MATTITKLSVDQLSSLMNTHLFHLTKEELTALAFVLDLEISDYKKTDWFVQFRLTHEGQSVTVESRKDSCNSIGPNAKTRKGLSNMIAWGGVFSMASTMKVIRGAFLREYSFTLSGPEQEKMYGKDGWNKIITIANDLIGEAA